jgi:superfamily II DNA helicase RecQ
MAALNDPDPGNPVAIEVARLIQGYGENFRAHVEKLGRLPESFLHVKPQSAIEAVAMRLTTDTIQQQLHKG